MRRRARLASVICSDVIGRPGAADKAEDDDEDDDEDNEAALPAPGARAVSLSGTARNSSVQRLIGRAKQAMDDGDDDYGLDGAGASRSFPGVRGAGGRGATGIVAGRTSFLSVFDRGSPDAERLSAREAIRQAEEQRFHELPTAPPQEPPAAGAGKRKKHGKTKTEKHSKSGKKHKKVPLAQADLVRRELLLS